MTARWDKALWQDVLAGLRVRAARSLLAAGAIALGACALTVLLAAVAGLEAHTASITRVLGTHTLAVLGAPPGGVPQDRLQLGQAQLLAANLPDVLVSAVRRDLTAANGRGRNLELISTDQNLAEVRGWSMFAGRFLDAGDMAYAERNMVITRALANQWGWHVGDLVEVQQSPFTVVGIVDTPAAGLEITALAPDIAVRDLTAFVARSVIPAWVNNQSVAPWGVDAIYLRTADDADMAATQLAAARLLQQAQLTTGHLAWITPAILTEGLNRLRDLVAAVAGGVTLLSLILGGITLTSLMVANVQDRIAEIGLRRSFGAEPRDVALLFVVEALTLTLAAACAGTLAAVLILKWGPALPLPVELDALTLLAPLAMGAALGALTAWWPARLAARVEPAQALRAT